MGRLKLNGAETDLHLKCIYTFPMTGTIYEGGDGLMGLVKTFPGWGSIPAGWGRQG